MYSFIRGELVSKLDGAVVVENNGVGYHIYVPTNNEGRMGSPGDKVELQTYLVVREDSLTLYGFLSQEERLLFGKLIGVAGVGPRVALSLLSSFSVTDFCLAVLHENVQSLTKVPGIGPKSARRLVLELKEKVSSLAAVGQSEAAQGDTFCDALDALLALGYNGSEAQSALQAVRRGAGKPVEDKELLRKALAYLGKS